MVDFKYCKFENDCCPWFGQNGNKVYITEEDTSVLPVFPGGWKSPTNEAYTQYGGVYAYNKAYDANGKRILTLDVIPNFSNNMWMGTAPACRGNINDCSDPDKFKDLKYPENLYPRSWTGYVSNKVFSKKGIQLTPSHGCNECTSGGMVLCSTNKQMSENSCPGATGDDKLSQPPFILEKDDYFNVDAQKYPRGIGTCIYPIDCIKNDDDLRKLINLLKRDEIPPDLVRDLALNYCYQNVFDKVCGLDSANGVITTCNKYMVDFYRAEDTPCKEVIDNLLSDPTGIKYVNTANYNWCNQDETKYTPLCDCIKAGLYRNDNTSSDIIRRQYSIISNNLRRDVISNVIPKELWFKPCNTYALKSYRPDNINIGTIQNCNNIINFDGIGDSLISGNEQLLSCVVERNTDGDNVQDADIMDPIIESFNISKGRILKEGETDENLNDSNRLIVILSIVVLISIIVLIINNVIKFFKSRSKNIGKTAVTS